MQDKETIVFSAGADETNGPYKALEGSWISAKNVLVVGTQSGGDVYEVKTPKGNVLIPNSGLPEGSYDFLGAEYDPATSHLYYAIRSQNNNRLYCAWWRYGNNGNELVLEHPDLNFLADQITSIDIVDGRIYWVDPVFNTFSKDVLGRRLFGNPKRFIIEKALRYTQSGGLDPLGYPFIDACTLDACKWPPAFPPACSFFNDETRQTNYISRKSFQFAYRYIYDGDEISKPSPISELCFPRTAETMNGNKYADTSNDNSVRVIWNSGNQTVNYVELMVRVGNDGSWFVFQKIDKKAEAIADDFDYPYIYTGTENLQAVPDQETFSFDLVPDVAKSQTYSRHANVIMYFGCQEGYNKPDLSENDFVLYKRRFKTQEDVVINIVNEEVPQPNGDIAWQVLYNFFTTIQDVTIGTQIVFAGSVFNSDDSILIKQFFFPVTIDQTFISNVGTGIQRRAFFINRMQEVLFQNFALSDLPNIRYEIGDSESSGFILIRARTEDAQSYLNVRGGFTIINYSLKKQRSLKDGVTHDFQLVYFREGNKTNGVTSMAMEVVVPFSGENTFPNETLFFSNHAYFRIRSEAPNYATHYALSKRERTGVGNFMQTSIYDIQNRQQQTVLSLDNYYEATFQASYNFIPQAGDVVTLRTYYRKTDSPLTTYEQVWYQKVVQATVIEYLPTGGTNGTKAVVIEGVQFTDIDLKQGSVIEIARPKTSSDSSPYFITKIYQCADGAHEGDAIELQVYRIDVPNNRMYVFGNREYLNQRQFIITGTQSNNVNIACSVTYDITTDLSEFQPNGYNFQGPETEFPLSAFLTAKLNQQGGFPAILVYEDGDVFIRERTMDTGLDWPVPPPPQSALQVVESNTFSDYWDSFGWSKGFLMPFNPNARQEDRFNLIRNSLPEIASTRVNGLSSFVFDESQEVGLDSGPIVSGRARGEALRVLQRRDVSSILVQRAIAANPEGTEQYILGTKILGPVTPSRQSNGAWSEESTIMIDGVIFYLNVLDGHVMKDTTGGAFSINAGLHVFWQNLCKKVFQQSTTNSPYLIRCGFNPLTNELYWSFFNSALEEAFTVVYNVMEGKWEGLLDFFSESFATLDTRCFSVLQNTGLMYEMNKGENGVFFGNYLVPSIKFYARKGIDQYKQILSMFVRGYGKPSLISVTAPANDNIPGGQYTETVIERGDGGYYVAVMNNMLSPGFTDQGEAALYGQNMRSNYFVVEIIGPDAGSFKINNVVLYYNYDNPLS